MSAAFVRRDSLAKPGGTVTYSIWVWSTIGSRQVSATVSSSGRHLDEPQFSLCPTVHGTTCSIGSLPAYQALEVLVTDHIRKKATSGEQIGLTVVVQGAGQPPSAGTLSPAEATVTTVVSPATSTPTLPPGTGTSFPTTVPGLPGTTVTPGSFTSLFPTVTPSPTPHSASQQKRSVTKVTSAASSLPLDPRLIGGQLAGLAVLAAAVTMVMARLSLRTPQLASGPQPGPAAAAAPPAQPATADAENDTDAETDADSQS